MNDEYTVLDMRDFFINVGVDEPSDFRITHIENKEKERFFWVYMPLIRKFFITKTLESAQEILIKKYIEFYRNDILHEMEKTFDSIEIQDDDFVVIKKDKENG